MLERTEPGSREKFKPEQLLTTMSQSSPSPEGNIRIRFTVALKTDPDKEVASAVCQISSLNPGFLTLNRIDVEKTHRYKGIGTSLMHHVCEYTLRHECGIKFVTDPIVRDEKPSSLFYVKFFRDFYKLNLDVYCMGGFDKGQLLYAVEHKILSASRPREERQPAGPLAALSLFAPVPSELVFNAMNQAQANATLAQDPAADHPDGVFLIRNSVTQPGMRVVEFFKKEPQGKIETASYLVPANMSEPEIRRNCVSEKALHVRPRRTARDI